MLRYTADIRSLLFMTITTGTLIFNWMQPELYWPTFALACFLPMPVYVMTHNHNHLPMWKNKILNGLQSYWLTLFYGFPTFAWIPTHNQNHHTFNNRIGDDTITYRISEKNNIFTLLSYPLVSSSSQMGANVRFLKAKLKNKPWEGAYYLSQLVLLIAYVVGAFLIDWQKALLYIFIPHQIGLNSVLLINYVQHVHADELSRWNHSRNFGGSITNWIMMNNGYHTVHHENANLHWSLAKKEHDRVKDQIDPRLNCPNLFVWLFQVYILGPFFPKYRTQSLRLERIKKEQETEKNGIGLTRFEPFVESNPVAGAGAR